MSNSDTGTQAGFFEATIWSTILKAKGDAQVPACQLAMERLLGRYRQPIFRHIQASLPPHRRSHEHAEDLTQEFIRQCLRLDFLKRVSADQGRFRTFIKACVKNFLRDQHARETAAKRGSGQIAASLDETDGEGRPLQEPAGTDEPLHTLLDREWALTILATALDQLEKEYVATQRGDLFAALKDQLGGASEPPVAKHIGELLGMTEGAVHTAMCRMRKRLGEFIRDEVRETVGSEADWREELRYLICLVGQ